MFGHKEQSLSVKLCALTSLRKADFAFSSSPLVRSSFRLCKLNKNDPRKLWCPTEEWCCALFFLYTRPNQFILSFTSWNIGELWWAPEAIVIWHQSHARDVGKRNSLDKRKTTLPRTRAPPICQPLASGSHVLLRPPWSSCTPWVVFALFFFPSSKVSSGLLSLSWWWPPESTGRRMQKNKGLFTSGIEWRNCRTFLWFIRSIPETKTNSCPVWMGLDNCCADKNYSLTDLMHTI